METIEHIDVEVGACVGAAPGFGDPQARLVVIGLAPAGNGGMTVGSYPVS